MTTTSLDTPFLDGGVRSTNYFNGRILSREDMQRDRDAARALFARLGRTVGHGVAYGLEVEAKAIGGSSVTVPIVPVHPGLAVNRAGDTVALDRDVDVALLQPAASTGAAAVTSSLSGSFNACAPPDASVYVTGTGVYVLTIAPAESQQGLAPVSGLGNAAASCNAKEIVSGVQFRLFQLTGLSGADLADEARLRNIAAYRCFLAEGAGVGAARDPFGTAAGGTLPTDPALTDCDVPVALFNWTATGGLRWVDLWAVRRRLVPAAPLERPAAAIDAGRLRTAEAALLQLEDEVRDLFTAGGPMELALATQLFRFLPPAGILPLFGLGASRGFDRLTLFSNRTTRGPIVLEGASVAPLLRASLGYPPIDLDERELIWTYLVRQNLQAQPGGGQPYFMFASGQLPPFGAARADVARVGFASVAIT